jgi:hypothetical protein
MAITVDLETFYGLIRLTIGDDEDAPKGVMPDGANFSDAQLEKFYELEGGDPDADSNTGHVGRASARACEALSLKWAKEPVQVKMGPASERMSASSYYAKRAHNLRQIYGHGGTVYKKKIGSMTLSNSVILPAEVG